jgi:hypothetical protein
MTYIPNLPQNELLTELLAKNAENAVTVMGYIGPDEGEDYILLYENLVDLSKCLEIKTNDIIHYTEAPKSVLPFGGVVLWLKENSEVISRLNVGRSKEVIADNKFQLENNKSVEIRAGRLFIVIEKEIFSWDKFHGSHPCIHERERDIEF